MQRAFPSFFDRRLSLEQAFSAQSVTLRDPLRSWSGIRDDDGGVVIAMRSSDIRSTGEGFSCLLWSPPAERRGETTDEARMEERLAHCRLALRAGGAEGLLVSGIEQSVQAGAIVNLHVSKRGNGYWASWGAAARFGSRPGFMSWTSERAPALAAA
jgi:hypothetical protein